MSLLFSHSYTMLSTMYGEINSFFVRLIISQEQTTVQRIAKVCNPQVVEYCIGTKLEIKIQKFIFKCLKFQCQQIFCINGNVFLLCDFVKHLKNVQELFQTTPLLNHKWAVIIHSKAPAKGLRKPFTVEMLILLNKMGH